MKIVKQPNTTVTKTSNNTVRITHTQSVKQSISYQTGDVTYGIELTVSDSPKEIQEGILRCERIVENALGEKLPEMQDLLKKLGSVNSKFQY